MAMMVSNACLVHKLVSVSVCGDAGRALLPAGRCCCCFQGARAPSLGLAADARRSPPTARRPPQARTAEVLQLHSELRRALFLAGGRVPSALLPRGLCLDLLRFLQLWDHEASLSAQVGGAAAGGSCASAPAPCWALGCLAAFGRLGGRCLCTGCLPPPSPPPSTARGGCRSGGPSAARCCGRWAASTGSCRPRLGAWAGPGRCGRCRTGTRRVHRCVAQALLRRAALLLAQVQGPGAG
jgi:hypothetical protein